MKRRFEAQGEGHEGSEGPTEEKGAGWRAKDEGRSTRTRLIKSVERTDVQDFSVPTVCILCYSRSNKLENVFHTFLLYRNKPKMRIPLGLKPKLWVCNRSCWGEEVVLEMLRKDDLIKILHAKNYIVKITFLDDNFYVVAVLKKKIARLARKW